MTQTLPAAEAPRGEPLLELCGLVVGHGNRPLLPPVDLELDRGWLVALLGRNGAGKSTLLETLAALRAPIAGSVSRRPRDLRTAYVPQVSGLDDLLPLRSIELVLQGRLGARTMFRPWSTREDREAAARALADAGARELARRRIRDLSRGERQRVLFARMLAAEAELAFLDEPTAAMDVVAEREALERIAELCHERPMTIVLASHAHDLAVGLADRVLFVDAATQTVLFDTPERVRSHPDFRRQLTPWQEMTNDAGP